MAEHTTACCMNRSSRLKVTSRRIAPGSGRSRRGRTRRRYAETRIASFSGSHVRLAAALVVAASLGAGTPAAAQERQPAGSELERIEALGLVTIQAGIPVLHVPGSGERAESVGSLMGDALRFFADSLGATADFRLALLGPDEWRRVTRHPYGLPHVSTRNGRSVAVLPADGGGVVHAEYARLEDRLSTRARDGLAAMGLEWDDAVRRMVDLVGLHEVGHVIVHQRGVRPPAKWLDEVLASYLAYVFLSARRPEQAALWDLMVDASLETQRPDHHTLADFERLYVRVGVSDYIWYQSMFARRAGALVREEGLRFLTELETELEGIDGGSVPPGGVTPSRLEELAPGFRDWARGFGDPGG